MTMRDFVCPDCGVVMKGDVAVSRKRCPRCAYLDRKRRTNEHNRQLREQMKEQNAIRGKVWRKPKPEPEISQAAAEQKKSVEQQNERVKKQRKQCASCKYLSRMYEGSGAKYCGFILTTGHCRDKGAGPGRCGSFEPQKGR